MKPKAIKGHMKIVILDLIVIEEASIKEFVLVDPYYLVCNHCRL